MDLPNGTGTSKLELTDVQYSPEIAYTLVSVGNLDEKGFNVKFGSGKCVITDPNGKTVGQVPKMIGAFTVLSTTLKQLTSYQKNLPWSNSIVVWVISLPIAPTNSLARVW